MSYDPKMREVFRERGKMRWGYCLVTFK